MRWKKVLLSFPFLLCAPFKTCCDWIWTTGFLLGKLFGFGSNVSVILTEQTRCFVLGLADANDWRSFPSTFPWISVGNTMTAHNLYHPHFLKSLKWINKLVMPGLAGGGGAGGRGPHVRLHDSGNDSFCNIMHMYNINDAQAKT